MVFWHNQNVIAAIGIPPIVQFFQPNAGQEAPQDLHCLSQVNKWCEDTRESQSIMSLLFGLFESQLNLLASSC